MIDADQQSAEVCGDEPDERDRSGDCGCGTAQDHCAECRHQSRPHDPLPEAGCDVVPQRQRVQSARTGDTDRRADSEERQHVADPLPRSAADAADLPEAEAVHHVDPREQDRADQ